MAPINHSAYYDAAIRYYLALGKNDRSSAPAALEYMTGVMNAGADAPYDASALNALLLRESGVVPRNMSLAVNAPVANRTELERPITEQENRSTQIINPYNLDILALQIRLLTLGYIGLADFNKITYGKLDNTTVRAIRSYQQTHGISETNLIDAETWQHMGPEMPQARWSDPNAPRDPNIQRGVDRAREVLEGERGILGERFNMIVDGNSRHIEYARLTYSDLYRQALITALDRQLGANIVGRFADIVHIGVDGFLQAREFAADPVSLLLGTIAFGSMNLYAYARGLDTGMPSAYDGVRRLYDNFIGRPIDNRVIIAAQNLDRINNSPLRYVLNDHPVIANRYIAAIVKSIDELKNTCPSTYPDYDFARMKQSYIAYMESIIRLQLDRSARESLLRFLAQ
jgi:hypothetical protein